MNCIYRPKAIRLSIRGPKPLKWIKWAISQSAFSNWNMKNLKAFPFFNIIEWISVNTDFANIIFGRFSRKDWPIYLIYLNIRERLIMHATKYYRCAIEMSRVLIGVRISITMHSNLHSAFTKKVLSLKWEFWAYKLIFPKNTHFYVN